VCTQIRSSLCAFGCLYRISQSKVLFLVFVVYALQYCPGRKISTCLGWYGKLHGLKRNLAYLLYLLCWSYWNHIFKLTFDFGLLLDIHPYMFCFWWGNYLWKGKKAGYFLFKAFQKKYLKVRKLKGNSKNWSWKSISFQLRFVQ